MVFSSLLFVFWFLAISLAVYTFVDEHYKNIVLLVSSLFFYSWGGPRYLILLVGETFISWFFAIQIEDSRQKSTKKAFLIGDLVIMLGLLGIFKYTGFFLGTFKALTGIPSHIPNIVLPIGISFYTFQLISYVVDVYRDEVAAQRVYWKLLLYSSLFHQCIAGPIVRYETVADEIDDRHVTISDIYEGVRRFSIGIAKKAILANSCAKIADTLVPIGSASVLASKSMIGCWIGIFCYMMQVYLDFSAYSDMAIGMGRMVGFHYLENFNYPLISKSVQEFWRRWHISLSSFFKDYVYIPLGGSRVSTPAYIRNMFIVWFLTGMWHGANWNYIAWGLYSFVFLLLEKFVIKDKIPEHLRRPYALFVLLISFAIFRFNSGAEFFTTFGRMFGIGHGGFFGMELKTVLAQNIFFLIFAVIACTPLYKTLRAKLFNLSKGNSAALVVFNVIEMITPALLLILATLSLIGNSYNPFLYFQF